MTTVSDEQLEQLEAYVDGELPASEEDALRRRLEAEPALAAALEQLRAERDLRAIVWASYEPSHAAVQRLVQTVEAKIDRHNVWAHRLSRWRIPSAAAACILIGFMVGWVGRGPKAATPGGGEILVSRPSVPANGIPTPLPMPGGGFATVGNPAPQGSGPVNGLGNGLGNGPAIAGDGPVELPVVDEHGKVVAVQRFKSVREANEFLEDLRRWQLMQQQAKEGNVVPPAGKERF